MPEIFRKERFWFICSLILLIPALLIGLGKTGFIEDEAIRALVALEMKLSGNFITSTLGGELYLKKPPLYNWIIAASFSIFGKADEFSARFPTIVSLLFFGLTVFNTMRKHLTWQLAAAIAFSVIVSGRILVYESQKGLIDILFSWVIYGLFMVVYNSLQVKKYWRLFLFAYMLTFVAYMLKGLPALVFLSLTLITALVFFKEWKKLFHPAHFVAIGIFAFLFLGFYLVYFNINHVPVSKVYSTLVGESTRRTVFYFGLVNTILHFFEFPLDVIFHFLPFTIFVVFFFSKSVRNLVFSISLNKYFLWIICTNILVYWTSPQVYARYLLMFVPLFYTLLIVAYSNASNILLQKWINGILGAFIILVSIAIALFPFFLKTTNIPFLAIKCLVLFISLVICKYWYFKSREVKLAVFITALLLIRIGFNWFIIPQRALETGFSQHKILAQQIAADTKGIKLFTYWPPNVEPDAYFGKRIFEYQTMFYITQIRGTIVKSRSNLELNSQYLIKSTDIAHLAGLKVSVFHKYMIGNEVYFLVGLNKTSVN